MGYALNEYGRDLTPEERKEKALNLAASYWVQWQWYDHRRIVWSYLIGPQSECVKNDSAYHAAAAILSLAYDMTASEIWSYCEAKHGKTVHDDLALDDPEMFPPLSVWIDGKPVKPQDVDWTP